MARGGYIKTVTHTGVPVNYRDLNAGLLVVVVVVLHTSNIYILIVIILVFSKENVQSINNFLKQYIQSVYFYFCTDKKLKQILLAQPVHINNKVRFMAYSSNVYQVIMFFLFVHIMPSETIKIKQHRLTQVIPPCTLKRWTGWFLG